jgi:hypothetical protein
MPDADQAVVPAEKLSLYLLNPNHPKGGAKARFFTMIGFDRKRPEQLEATLLAHAASGTAVMQDNPWASTYRITGAISAPNGKSYDLVSVWQIDAGSGIIKLLTAFPGRR